MPDSYEQLAAHFERIRQENVSAKERDRQEFRQLVADHSEALKFVREMSIRPCPHWCADDCLACRTKAWLHEANKEPKGDCHHCDEPMPNGRCWWCGGPNKSRSK